MINIAKNNMTTYAINITNSGHRFSRGALKKNISRTNFSPNTNGLKYVIVLRPTGIASSGNTTPEKNKNKLPEETEANTAVSSEVKRYPITIPIKVNTDPTKNKTIATNGNAAIP